MIHLRKQTLALVFGSLLGCAAVHGALIPVTSDIAAGTTQTWYATNTYLLNTIIYVQSNAVLNIEAGTVIYGATNVTVARTDIPNLVSALWVTRGGKLDAQGTVDKPIIFTAEGDDLAGRYGPSDTGLWGGVVLMGKGLLNTAKDVVGNAASPKHDVYEGVDGPGPNGEHIFGGGDDEDSSGVLKYVSIRHAGNEFAPASELNALTMGAVGRGTVVEYVETYAGSDDGFEWWGGAVNGSHLVSAFCEDDDFDTDQGYRGTNQFLFAIKYPGVGTGDSRGFESDGDLNQSARGEQPLSKWVVYNATLIGRGKTETSGGLGVAWNTRDESAPNVFNSVFAGWNQGLKLDTDGLLHFTNNPVEAFVENNLWDVTTGSDAAGAFLFTTAAFANSVEDAKLGGVSYLPDGGLDPRPQEGSSALGGALGGAPVAVSYRGAFSSLSDSWADGWTALSNYGYLAVASVSAPKVIMTYADGSFTVMVSSQYGYRYSLQSTSGLADPVWTTIATLNGNGETLMFPSAATSGPSEFFRVVVE